MIYEVKDISYVTVRPTNNSLTNIRDYFYNFGLPKSKTNGNVYIGHLHPGTVGSLNKISH